MKRVIIITSHELRHKFLCHYFSSQKNINFLYGIHEEIVKLSENIKLNKYKIFKKHVSQRSQSEKKYFRKYSKRYKSIYVKKGTVNETSFIKKIKKDRPDFIITFGCSILNENFIKNFKNKTINIHLGLSPYYTGSGTNFFPFVNNELQFLGSTIMKISKKIDQGQIITQVRPKINSLDTIHDVGNKIILQTAKILVKIILSKKIYYFKNKIKYKTKNFKRKDFTIEALKKAYHNLEVGIIEKYLKKGNKIKKDFPIINKY